MTSLRCPTCGTRIQYAAEAAGQASQCPSCYEAVRFPHPPGGGRGDGRPPTRLSPPPLAAGRLGAGRSLAFVGILLATAAAACLVVATLGLALRPAARPAPEAGVADKPGTSEGKPPSYKEAWTREHRPSWVDAGGPAGVVYFPEADWQHLSQLREDLRKMIEGGVVLRLSVQPNVLVIDRTRLHEFDQATQKMPMLKACWFLDYEGFFGSLEVRDADGASVSSGDRLRDGQFHLYGFGLPTADDYGAKRRKG